MPLTLAEKDDICPRRIRASHGNDGFHFEMLRQNINKKNASYSCVHKRGCNCKATLFFKRSEESGFVDITNKTWRYKYSRKCVVMNNPSLDPGDYPWEGKPVSGTPEGLNNWTEMLGPDAGPIAAAPAAGVAAAAPRPPLGPAAPRSSAPGRSRPLEMFDENADPNHDFVFAPNVEEDMKLRVDELATNDLSMKRSNIDKNTGTGSSKQEPQAGTPIKKKIITTLPFLTFCV